MSEVTHMVAIDKVGWVYHNLERLKPHHGYEVVPIEEALRKDFTPGDCCY